MQSQLVILRRSFLEVVQDQCADLRQPAQFCAAKLLDYFLHWTEWKMKNYHHFRIERRMIDIRQDLMQEYSLHTLREAIGGLVSAGLLHQESDPNGQSKTWHYWLDLGNLLKWLKPGEADAHKLQQQLGQLWTRIQAKLQIWSVRRSDLNAERSTTERYTQLPSTSFDPQHLGSVDFSEPSEPENVLQDLGSDAPKIKGRSVKPKDPGEDATAAPGAEPVENLTPEQRQLLKEVAIALKPDIITPAIQHQVLQLPLDKVRQSIAQLQHERQNRRTQTASEILLGLLCDRSEYSHRIGQQMHRLGWRLEQFHQFVQEKFATTYARMSLNDLIGLSELMQGL